MQHFLLDANSWRSPACICTQYKYMYWQSSQKYSFHINIHGIPKIQEGQSTFNRQWNPAKSIEVKCLNCTLPLLRAEVVQMQGARCESCPPAMYIYISMIGMYNLIARSTLIKSYLGKVKVYMDWKVIAV